MLNSIHAENLFSFFTAAALFSLIIYLPRIVYYISGLMKPVHLSNPEKNRLAVIVPAKNEKGVTVLLDSIAAQTYDKEFFDTYVVVDNAEDETVEICRLYKNTFSFVVEKQTCKGEALDGILRHLLAEEKKPGGKKYAGFIVVDADNVLDANFVMEMNNALMSGRQIILGKRRVKNYLYSRHYRSWSVNCSALTYTFLDKMGNAFRSSHGMSCTLCGTGIMVRHDVLEEMGGWPYRTMTEDLELTINALLNEWTSFFYEYAVTYTEEGISHKSANARRFRWVFGYAQISMKYRKMIAGKFYSDLIKKNFSNEPEEVKKAVPAGNLWGCFDYLYAFFPLFIYFGVSVICALIFLWSSIVHYCVNGYADYQCLKYAFAIIGIIYAVLVIYTGIGLYEDRESFTIDFDEKIAMLFGNPFFVTEYAGFFVKSYILLILGKSQNKNWVQVERMNLNK